MKKWFEQAGEQADVVVSTRIRLIRNLREYPFPAKMNREDRRALIAKVMDVMKDGNLLLPEDFAFLDMEQLSKTEAVSLVERHIASPEFISESDGRGALLSGDESVSILLNSENHLQLQVLCRGLDLYGAYEKADRLDTVLDKALHFAFDEALGFLTQSLANLGTGMRASLLLHLPALAEGGGIGRMAANLAKLGLALRGIYGTGTQPKGAMYQLSNQVSLGLTEQEALTNLNSIAMQVISQERAARRSLAEKLEVQDVISRSLAILQSARVLRNDEFMDLISNVRFGIAAGLVSGLEFADIDRLMIQAQPATLTLSSGKKLSLSERHALRAQAVSRALTVKSDKEDGSDGRAQEDK